MRWGVQFEGYFEVNEVKGMGGCYKPCENSPFPFTFFSHRSVKTQKSLLFPSKNQISSPKRVKIGQGYGPSALVPGSQKSPGSEKTPPKKQPGKVSAAVSTFSSYDPPKTPSPRLAIPPKMINEKKVPKITQRCFRCFFGSLRSYNSLPCLKRVQS